MSKVFVLDTHKQPLDPVHPSWARKLLSSGKAAVWRRYPFTIVLKRDRLISVLNRVVSRGSMPAIVERFTAAMAIATHKEQKYEPPTRTPKKEGAILPRLERAGLPGPALCDALAYYDDLARKWVAEAGEFEILVGASSQDIRATTKFTLTASSHWPF